MIRSLIAKLRRLLGRYFQQNMKINCVRNITSSLSSVPNCITFSTVFWPCSGDSNTILHTWSQELLTARSSRWQACLRGILNAVLFLVVCDVSQQQVCAWSRTSVAYTVFLVCSHNKQSSMFRLWERGCQAYGLPCPIHVFGKWPFNRRQKWEGCCWAETPTNIKRYIFLWNVKKFKRNQRTGFQWDDLPSRM
jgi:hypothetical protein